jgi:hypothetical protein
MLANHMPVTHSTHHWTSIHDAAIAGSIGGAMSKKKVSAIHHREGRAEI